HGEVTKPETINYRTLKPEKDGLFCERIFGPSKDWECYCGKYKRVRHRGITCERCGVEVTDSKVRRHRMGHINLASPVTHIWFLKGIPSYIGLLLDLPLRDLEQVVYFNAYIVTNPGNVPDLSKSQLLTEEEYEKLLEEPNYQFDVGIGAEAIKQLLHELARPQYERPDNMEDRGRLLDVPGLQELSLQLRDELNLSGGSQQKRAKIIKRLRLVEALLSSHTDPTWVVLDNLPVTPPDLRPMVQLDGGRFATSDLNDLYRRVINRNNRLARLLEMGAPEIIVRNEKRMLQEAVDALIDNGRRGRVVVGPNNRPLKSLSNIIEGKQGRFRQNLLGKRVDYSGRSVIVVGPTLKLHQCGLPREMALELFKPFVINKLIERQIVQNIKSAKKQIEKGSAVVWEILEEVIQGHPVLLNRAPTLHRLGIQAFEPVLVEGRAIQLHPLVCAAFNADFDGDQMAVHVPLSVEAQAEAHMLMLASNNILLPATGRPTITPTQDMVLGLYYLTIEKPGWEDPKVCRGAGMRFVNMADARAAFEADVVNLHAKIAVRDHDGEKIETTPGRIIFNETVRQSVSLGSLTKQNIKFINDTADKKLLGKLLSQMYERFGTARTAELANSLKDLGFTYATRAGVTISIDDLDVPEAKRGLIAAAEKEIEEAQRRYERGDITEVERYNKVIDTWSATTDKLTKEVVDNFNRLNPVYMMAFSGARGNISQVRQLVGMRGLMADSQGQIIDLPIKANFREGLNVTEYIISSYGARKGLVDTALKTADSGYLTRRLVDVAQDVIVREPDCFTLKGIAMQPIMDGNKAMVRLSERVFGRTMQEDFADPETGEVIARRGEICDRKGSDLIDKLDEKMKPEEKEILVRSPLTCESQYGVCQKCYGWSLTTNRLVDTGEAIGIIAAQSIGEPGTQLTMRTFHTGGAVAGGKSRPQVKSPVKGTVSYKIQTRQVRTAYGDVKEQTTRDGVLKITPADGKKEKTINLPTGSLLEVENGDEVTAGTLLAEYDPPGAKKTLTERASKDITSDIAGRVVFAGFQADEKRDRQGNISRTANRAGIIWVLEGDVYNLPSGSQVVVKDGQDVKAMDVLAEISILTEHGGEVRFGTEIETEQSKRGRKTVTKLVKGKEINIVIAQVGSNNAKLDAGQKGAYWKIPKTKETWALKVVKDEVVENGKIIAESIEDGSTAVTTGGEIIYDGVEIDDRRVVVTPGKVLFVPEEVHFISKDISLKMVETGDVVAAGQEVVKDVFAHMEGVVEIVADNDIIHEVIIRPGELVPITDPSELKVAEGQIIEPGTEIVEGYTSKERKMASLFENEDGTFQVLVRPVEEYWIEPRQTKFKHKQSDERISLRPVTQLLFRDREKVRQLQGAQLTRTSLVLQMQGYLQELKGIVEMEDELNIVVQENILLRREQDFNVTLLEVENGQIVEAKTPVATTQVLTRSDARVQLSKSDERRLLLITEEQQIKQTLNGPTSIQAGDLVRISDKLTKSSKKDQEETICEQSGQVVDVTKEEITIRKGRPYLISSNTQLQSEDGALVQRGDLLATLIFERQKTGDIVQGLPRVEELLEARKPKECAILSEREGRAKIVVDDDIKRVYIVYDDGSEEEIVIPPGMNILIDDGDHIKVGKPITDGPPNPHDVVRLLGFENAQKFLVDEVQSVYRSQGVEIADKHIEVIVRQMTRKVRVDDPKDTILLPGELMERFAIERENEKALQSGQEPATYTDVLLGITKASLNTESFISAASFQETTRILTEAAVEGKKDWLRGLKENVIIGRLIPAGTGFQGHQQPPEEEEEEQDIYPPIGEGSFNVQ
ncbi:MAG: DNA-directed RNA polymerase subunit beta', partial [Cyanobacteria bacterium]|nr:DNA-directed RNA polymerase subunit beta' [Cyanobacteriota bacterium]